MIASSVTSLAFHVRRGAQSVWRIVPSAPRMSPRCASSRTAELSAAPRRVARAASALGGETDLVDAASGGACAQPPALASARRRHSSGTTTSSRSSTEIAPPTCRLVGNRDRVRLKSVISKATSGTSALTGRLALTSVSTSSIRRPSHPEQGRRRSAPDEPAVLLGDEDGALQGDGCLVVGRTVPVPPPGGPRKTDT